MPSQIIVIPHEGDQTRLLHTMQSFPWAADSKIVNGIGLSCLYRGAPNETVVVHARSTSVGLANDAIGNLVLNQLPKIQLPCLFTAHISLPWHIDLSVMEKLLTLTSTPKVATFFIRARSEVGIQEASSVLSKAIKVIKLNAGYCHRLLGVPSGYFYMIRIACTGPDEARMLHHQLLQHNDITHVFTLAEN